MTPLVINRPRAAAVVGVAVLAALGGGLMMTLPRDADVQFAPPQPSAEFNGDSAYKYLADVCTLGPRLSASKAMARQQEILKAHFEKLGATVELQQFEGVQPSRPQRPFACANLVVHWGPDKSRRILLGCHYDTRPMADNEPPLSGRRGPFIGANDGASGVGFLMELGRVMPQLKTNVGVDFVFFDAEEYIFDSQADHYFLGSEYFVKQYLASKPTYRYTAVLVLDMIGGKTLELHPDVQSFTKSGPLVQEIWAIAAELGVREFQSRPKHDIRDDHEPFLTAGINAAVLIDFDYPHWHRLSDQANQCSAESLSKVASVVIEWLKRRS